MKTELKKEFERRRKLSVANKKAWKNRKVLEAIKELEGFFQTDMWYASNEWKTEEDMVKYLEEHFNICKNKTKKIIKE